MGRTVSLELPDTEVPDLTPQVSELRERLARIEERTLHATTDPAAAESLSLASEAHRLLGEMAGRVAALESAAERVPAQVENAAQGAANDVLQLPAPAEPPPVATPEVEPTSSASPEPHHPWWSPLRYL